MAMVSNAFSTYGAKGNREDLSNAIYNIDPFDTPIMSLSRRRNAKNRTFDWQTENLPNVDPNNAQPEGFELVRSAATPTVRRSNVCQISKRDATVTGSQEASDAAGKGSEMGHQMAMASKILKADMETIMSSRQARDDGADPNTPRKTEAIGHWLGRAVDKSGNPAGAVIGVTTGLPVAATDAFPAVAGASQIALTEVMLGDAMQKAFTNGGRPDNWVVPPGIKRTVSTFQGRSSSQVLVGKTEVVATVDVIATDFGRVKVMPSLWLPADVAYLLDADYLATAFFRNFRSLQIAKIGDAETRVVLCEWGVEMRNQLAHVMMNGIKQGAVITTMAVQMVAGAGQPGAGTDASGAPIEPTGA
jgi:Family of unknown function (DUF5309)